MAEDRNTIPIKSAIARDAESPGLFQVIVEIRRSEKDVYLLLPMTNRVMPLEIVSGIDYFVTIEDIASAIGALPENTNVYAANPSDFSSGKKRIRRLTDLEINHLAGSIEKNPKEGRP